MRQTSKIGGEGRDEEALFLEKPKKQKEAGGGAGGRIRGGEGRGFIF